MMVMSKLLPVGGISNPFQGCHYIAVYKKSNVLVVDGQVVYEHIKFFAQCQVKLIYQQSTYKDLIPLWVYITVCLNCGVLRATYAGKQSGSNISKG